MAAALHLIEQDAQQFAFFGADAVRYTQLRADGLKLTRATASMKYARPQLSEQLQPPHRARAARRILLEHLSARESYSVPVSWAFAAVTIISSSESTTTPPNRFSPALASAASGQPIRETGYLSAKALHQLLDSGRLASTIQVQTPAELIARESSLTAGRARIAQQALNFVTEHLHTPELEMETLAHQIGVSRCVMELRSRSNSIPAPTNYSHKLASRGPKTC